MNYSIGVKNPKIFELTGCVNSIVISGLLSGLSFTSVKEHANLSELALFYIDLYLP